MQLITNMKPKPNIHSIRLILKNMHFQLKTLFFLKILLSFHFQGWISPKMGSTLLVAMFIALQFATGMANPEAKRLYDDLLSNYNRLIRPVGNNSDRLTVKMGLRLSQLIDVVSIFGTIFNLSIVFDVFLTVLF